MYPFVFVFTLDTNKLLYHKLRIFFLYCNYYYYYRVICIFLMIFGMIVGIYTVTDIFLLKIY